MPTSVKTAQDIQSCYESNIPWKCHNIDDSLLFNAKRWSANRFITHDKIHTFAYNKYLAKNFLPHTRDAGDLGRHDAHVTLL